MACRGVHFAITDEQARSLFEAEDEDSDEKVREVIEEIEEAWDEEFTQETDKAWDAIHRCLSDGTLELSAGSYPLKMCIFGGRQLCYSGDYYVVYVAPNEVKDVAAALANLSRDWVADRYWKIPDDYQGSKSEEDLEYTQEYLDALKPFYQKAASANRAVIFTVDQ
jgi:transcriptional/translational regulatory protein YebC/TACO1